MTKAEKITASNIRYILAMKHMIDEGNSPHCAKLSAHLKCTKPSIHRMTKTLVEKTIIMITHRLKTVRNADQIIVIDKGKIVQKGKHEDLMKQDGIYRNFITGRKQAVSWKIA